MRPRSSIFSGRSTILLQVSYQAGSTLICLSKMLFLSTLDHGMVYGWNLTSTCKMQSVHPDNFLVKAWALLHHAGFLTYFHHDVDGGNTYIKVENHNGVKFWCLAFPKDGRAISRTALIANFALFADLKKNRNKIESKWDFEVVTILPGDLL